VSSKEPVYQKCPFCQKERRVTSGKGVMYFIVHNRQTGVDKEGVAIMADCPGGRTQIRVTKKAS